jgi:Carboxypeptidase regulatory-like domain
MGPKFCSGFALFLFSSATLLAQTSGSLTGQVLDASQSSVPSARVLAENIATGQRREATTNAAGRYTIPDLAIGNYKITAEQKGFQPKVFPSVQVGVAQAVTLDISLATGVVAETIDVTAQSAVLDGTTGAAFDNRAVVELPINGRDYARFSLLTPGAVASSNYIAMLTFNGQQSIHNQFQIDGVDATRVDQPYMANGFERGARLLTGSLETIEEFRAQTSSYPAEYGRAAGTYVNIATKSGTNQFHFGLLEFFRNNALDARNFFNTKPSPQAEFRYNNFGGNVGGPIIKNKTFFFANYEGSRQRVGITGTGTVPSVALRAQVLQKSPALADIVGLFPLGTSSTSNPLIDSYTTTATSNVREDTGSVKIDHSFSDKNNVYVRVNVNDSHVFGPLFGVTSTALGLQDFQNVPIRTSNVAIHDQHVFSPQLVNEFLTGMQRWGSKIISDEPYPLTTITGLTAAPGTRGRTLSNNTSYQMSDSLSLTKGTHNFKTGFQLYRIQLDRRSINTTSMTYTSITDFINNSIFSASQSVGNPGTATRGYQIAAFAQDSWHILRNVTLDYGLRWDYDPPPFDPGNHQQTFSLATNTLAPGGTPLFNGNKTNFSPRTGVAWQVTKRIMARAGYGIFYQAYPVGFGSNIVTNNLPGNTTLLRSQIPLLSYPINPFLSQGSLALPSVSGFDPNRHDNYAHQWNVTLGFALTESTALTTAYVGNHSLNLRRSENINLINPATGARPIAGFSNVNIEMNNGQGIYDGLQINLKQRLKYGFQFGFSYAYGHSIDDVQDYGIYSTNPQDNNNLKAERGNSGDDVRHTASYQVIYELPFGAGKRFLNGNGLISRALGGWQISSVGQIRTGIASTVLIGVNTYGNGNLTNQRPNAVVGVNQYAANKNVNSWLNPAAFSLPAAGTFGNLGRNTFYGPGYAQEDLSLIKNTVIHERYILQFRAEVFNFVNHPNFDLPQATYNTSTFGQTLNTFGRTLGGGVSRQIQLALKLNF